MPKNQGSDGRRNAPAEAIEVAVVEADAAFDPPTSPVETLLRKGADFADRRFRNIGLGADRIEIAL